jgi:hypothetical protein
VETAACWTDVEVVDGVTIANGDTTMYAEVGAHTAADMHADCGLNDCQVTARRGGRYAAGPARWREW